MDNSKKIALLCPSLKRPERKMNLIHSIMQTVADPSNITLFLGIDSEGDPTLEISKQISKSIPFLRVVELSKNCKGRIHACWNELAKVAYDEGYGILSMFADDFVPRTYGWDRMVIEEFTGDKLPKDNWKLLTVSDLHVNGRIPVNFFVPRYYYELMGYIACDAYVICWADNHIMSHFTPFNRYFYRSDIVIEHQHWCFSQSGEPDEIGRAMLERKKGSEAECDDMFTKMRPERYKEVLKIAKATGLTPDFTNW